MIQQTLRQSFSMSLQVAKLHPKRVSAALLVLLGGFTVTAFGIAPMAPDAANLPQRMVSETLTVQDLPTQVDALATHNLQLYRSTVTRRSDTADSLLARLGVSEAQVGALVRKDPLARAVIEGSAGKMVQARTGANGQLLELVARFQAQDSSQADTHFTRVTLLRRDDGQFVSSLESVPLQSQVLLGSGTVRTSLWAATETARLPDAVAAQMIDIFAGDIDFHRELRRGDTFSVVYEALTADGQPITWNDGVGRVLAADYTNKGRSFQAVWHSDSETGKGAYFTLDGQSRRRAYLASPLAFSRITSGFAMRMHPLLHTMRAHNGVDYAAPTGTSVKSVGDGVVEFAGHQGGYGNVVQVKHANNQTTLYAHLSRIKVKAGQRLEQGHVVGLVGATGWATGPHLHFEFRVDGKFRDPLEVARATQTMTIRVADRARFEQSAQVARHKLTTADSITQFRGDAE